MPSFTVLQCRVFLYPVQFEQLFTAGENSAEFQRSVSRLLEMQSVQYLQTERRRAQVQ